ncbi:coiled-coil domain-containing protein 120 [Microcaecilia unicolor]|uniref:Coiled-coil domain-containing protein 120 n=1 Tax=Microcaecilia unicolor TaxID=1415580 RepID=A0A6P7X971_9AMPH|nr:coiled-coil domain-containing protein 120 [Microcaecilia unicolor]XP_030049854.1 coiled-coil domain-containing protein 120 [Microcaecilia unicolor]XP_030049855.1 coiled-coil domain-containing protein 120 [Microcaecilia unicolor]XP_030049856.1 coiled-coil domain-containing protein 120 [Microcaecilia unicolor]XP_030049858.1 coiled-coil domain-containing protein 120 [Microcaecilia unicolor]XP_030049859.1 coiled-coil domain-containing protein 120 [Microcaecilia unicolor]
MAYSQLRYSTHESPDKLKRPPTSNTRGPEAGSTSPGMEVRTQLITPASYSSPGSPFCNINPKVRAERIRELMEKQRNLQEALSVKVKELKRLCLQEAELTGQVPAEYPLELGERLPYVRRRGAAPYRNFFIPTSRGEDAQLEVLEREFSLQHQIAEAARKLALAGVELTADQRRKRRHVYADALKRLQEIEEQANELRLRLGRKPTQRALQIIQDDSLNSDSSSVSESASYENADAQGFPSGTRLSPPRLHPRAISSSPERQPQQQDWRLSPADACSEIRSRRNSVASPPSPARTFPRSASGFEGRSVPATPILSRSICSKTHSRPENLGLAPNQHWATSQDPPSVIYTPQTRRSSSSEALIDRSSCEQRAPNQLRGVARAACKSSEALSERSVAGRTAVYQAPDQPPFPQLWYHYKRPGSAWPPNGAIHGEALLDYYIERQHGVGHCSRRDAHVPPDSPALRSKAQAARAKSCGPPRAALQAEATYQQQQLWPVPGRPPPRSRSQQRAAEPPDHGAHKAAALEGLRDWYIRNAAGYRCQPDRRTPAPTQRYHEASHLESYYYNTPIPHSVSFNGPPYANRHYADYLYEENLSSHLNETTFNGGMPLNRDFNAPGTLV